MLRYTERHSGVTVSADAGISAATALPGAARQGRIFKFDVEDY
ncbi:hypothetical protein [Chitinilyticum aquatile]|nr:hypothetical protein [Chitinilyticum aquatile]